MPSAAVLMSSGHRIRRNRVESHPGHDDGTGLGPTKYPQPSHSYSTGVGSPSPASPFAGLWFIGRHPITIMFRVEALEHVLEFFGAFVGVDLVAGENLRRQIKG